MQPYLSWFLKGLAMGAANVIPGVSGGTIAFITNIYERFINALKSLDLDAVSLLFKGKIKELIIKIDFWFLLSVLGGVAVSILSLAKLLEFLFLNYETLTLAFFFGLIIASIVAVGSQIESWNSSTVVALIVGTAIAISIAFLPPANANDAIWYVFLCGVVAVCSMILPGLSGSYILLLMGNYILVLQAISGFKFKVIIPMAAGCIVGLLLFSRLLSYLFAHYKSQTIALLTGFVTGSLVIIWPWKTAETITIEDKEKVVGYTWEMPELNGAFAIAFLLILIGFGLVFFIERTGQKKPAK
ncbi:MAG: DUF368 domain-containing protein [Cytophagales bacterium]|nr:DUF368 domain-containing protein [Cytophagales bacterium]